MIGAGIFPALSDFANLVLVHAKDTALLGSNRSVVVDALRLTGRASLPGPLLFPHSAGGV